MPKMIELDKPWIRFITNGESVVTSIIVETEEALCLRKILIKTENIAFVETMQMRDKSKQQITLILKDGTAVALVNPETELGHEDVVNLLFEFT